MRSKKNVLYSFVNPQAKLLKCNRSFLSISGATSITDIIGKEVKEVFQFFQSDKICDAVNSCLAHPEQKITIEIEVVKNGSHHHFEWIIFAEETDGIINGVHLVGRNADLKKQAQQNLLQQAKLLSFIEEAVIAVDRNLQIISWNEAASKLHGINAENAIGKTIQHIIPYDFSTLNSFSIYRKLSGGQAWNGQVALRHDSGLLLVEPSVTVFKNEDDEITGFIAVIRRKRDPFLPFFAASEHPLLFKEAQELYRNRALFEMIVEHAPLEAWVTDEDGIIRYMNPKYQESFNVSVDLNKSIFDLFPQEMADSCWQSTKKAIKEERIVETVEKGVKKDGTPGIFRIFKFPLMFGDKKMAGGWCIEITEQMNLQEKLIFQEKNKKSEIVKSIIETQEKERRELSIELHDNVNQILSSCKLMLEVAQENKEHTEALIARSSDSLQVAITEIRKISHDLNPSTIDDIGIVEAINELIEKMHLTGKIVMQFNHEGFGKSLPLISEDKIAIYRIVQEQLNNIIKHADATQVHIDLKMDFPFVSLKIKDDGRGFDTLRAKRGLGLKNIYHRVEYYRGNMDLVSEVNHGCLLDIKLNLSRE